MLSLQVASAYPISPRTLRKLVKDAELIVWSRVLKIEEVEGKTFYEEAKAILVVKEVLQGTIKQDTIAVYFSPGMICPAPAYYVKGMEVLAFLDKKKYVDGYTTHALSYGAKPLEPEQYEVYKTCIAEIKDIQLMPESEAKNVVLLDWFIKCASHPATRWEGTYELSPESDFMLFYDEDSETIHTRYELMAYQLLALAEAPFSTTQMTREDLGLVDLLIPDSGEQVLQYLQNQLKNGDLKAMWYRNDLIERIVYLTGRSDLEAILQKINSLDFRDEHRQKKSLTLARDFVDMLG